MGALKDLVIAMEMVLKHNEIQSHSFHFLKFPSLQELDPGNFSHSFIG